MPHLLIQPAVEWGCSLVGFGHTGETAGACPALGLVPFTFSPMATSDAADETWSIPAVTAHLGARGPRE